MRRIPELHDRIKSYLEQNPPKTLTEIAEGVSTPGCDLRLMSSLNHNGIPTEGKNLIVVAAVDNMLHFRIFEGDGKVVVDTDETRLTEQARQIKDLRKQLQSLWPPYELTTSEKGRVITAVTSIVGHTRTPDKKLRSTTVLNYINDLIRQKQVVHIKSGYTINHEWREGQLKAYVFIETVYREGEKGENYQIKFVGDIQRGFDEGKYPGLHLTAVEIVMGADKFDLITVILADDVYPLGQFVTGYLRTEPNVLKTHTVLVWPKRPRS